MAGKMLTASTVAQRLGISRSHVYRSVERGDLPAVRIGGALRFSASAVERLISIAEGTVTQVRDSELDSASGSSADHE